MHGLKVLIDQVRIVLFTLLESFIGIKLKLLNFLEQLFYLH